MKIEKTVIRPNFCIKCGKKTAESVKFSSNHISINLFVCNECNESMKTFNENKAFNNYIMELEQIKIEIYNCLFPEKMLI